jgi:guanylate kinase
MNLEKVIIFSAPSGAGKTTITRYILDKVERCEFSVSATTRGPRTHEKNGFDYYFISVDDFKDRIKNDAFVEWEEVYNNHFYGTLKSEVNRIWEKGNIVLFDVDVKGGINLKKYFGEKALSIFIMPPSMEVLEERLRKRATETEEAVQMRVTKAHKEMEYHVEFDCIVMNDDLATAQNDAYHKIITTAKISNPKPADSLVYTRNIHHLNLKIKL